ncbi:MULTISPECIES: fimbria/pilus periplasmic chaperone [Gibbsiella]|uniref:Probable fimbrial chaperone EcpB n=1 Tax=Gibbsiella dentisursi TaxID=796890 RepID=A0ABP7M6P1_9GAMM|nr:fimbria/pilus periplasmic chaperone [Gibbsiella quercinecans]
MKKIHLVISFPLFFSQFSSAIDVGDPTFFVESNQKIAGKIIKNSVNESRFLKVSVQRVSSPLKGGIVISPESKDELLAAPPVAILQPNAEDTIRFFYNGPADGKERYYRVIWDESPLSTDDDLSTSNKVVQAMPHVRVSTIMVVRPRNVKWDAKYTNGVIMNTGNTSLKTIYYGECTSKGLELLKRRHREKDNTCKEVDYILPGNTSHPELVNIFANKAVGGVWEDGQFIKLN